MESLKTLVNKYFPDETIQNQKRVTLSSSGITKMGIIPLAFGIRWDIKPMDMIETDKKLFFDRREPLMFFSFISIFIGPAWFILFLFIMSKLIKEPINSSIYITAIILALGTGLINFILTRSISYILTVPKDLIDQNRVENNKTSLDLKLNPGEHYFFSFPTNMSKEQREKLSFLDKLTSGSLFGETIFTFLSTSIFSIKSTLEFKEKN